ncbi:MAG: endolytic transglycosylase MltG [Holophagales bacterium]|nr:endolytic transglycosylase MltG [Holophagales bacterium]
MKALRRLLVALALLIVLAAAGALALFLWARGELERPHAFAHPVTVEVAPGTSSRAILERLEREGVLDSATLARLWLVRRLGDPPLKAGEYRFEPPLSALEVLDKLRRGEVATWPVTVPEGLTLRETAETLARAGFGDLERLLAEFGRPDRIADLDPEARNLEGYLFPDTYRFRRSPPEREIADALVAAFRRRFEREVRPLRPDDDRRSLRELVILASLVEKEAKLDSERPLIASVYANRLARGIGLYADPTIIYGLKLEGRWDGNLRRRDLEADSPWNTYRVPGLPPGPICSPGVASLAAAAVPADAPYLYFVSRNDGSHVFSETLAEHNRNVDRWQRRYFRELRAAGRSRVD